MVNIGEDQQTHLYVLQSHRQFNGGFRPSDKGAHPDPDISSLRSKRFQSSYSAKFGAGAKKKWKGGGEREEFLHSPPPPPSFLFLLSFQFSLRTRAEPLTTQAMT